MSFGLGHGKTMDPGAVGLTQQDLPALPDDVVTNPGGARVDPRAWFDVPDRPLELEIGSGKGTFLVQQAGLQPETNFLGIEWAREFWLYAADRVRRRVEAGDGLGNVRLLHTDATEFLRWRCPSETFGVIHLYFSDPWPKAKHHKKRVVQHRFLLEAWRTLLPGGELRVVTDHDDLWAWDEAHFDLWATPGDEPRDRDALAARIPAMPSEVSEAMGDLPMPPFERLAFDRPESAGEGELVGTNFERKFREEGRSFNAAVLRKRAGA
ncbi:MAG: hypothetical protein AAF356_12050 [Planctomycetota bacterium]